MPRRRLLLRVLAASFALVAPSSTGLAAPPPPPPPPEPEAPAEPVPIEFSDGVTLAPGVKGQDWQPGAKTNKKEQKYRASRGRRSPGTVSISIAAGRGSVFVNDRFAGTAPVEGYGVPAGKNDIQVRDGSMVLAEGVLTVPKNGTITMTVPGP